MTLETLPSTAWRPRWRPGATGWVAPFAEEWASPNTWADRDQLAEIVRQMPNGDQIEIVEVTLTTPDLTTPDLAPLAEAALPNDAPGAWIRRAIERHDAPIDGGE